MLSRVCLPFPFLTPVLTNERRTPTVHNLRAYRYILHVSDYFTLSRRMHQSKTQTHSYSQNALPKAKAYARK